MADNTGTIHSRSVTVFEQISTGIVRDTFVASATLKKGQAVKLVGEAEVGPITANTDAVIGHVMNGGVADDEVTVLVNYVARAKGFNNSGGSIPIGSLVRQVVPFTQTQTDKTNYVIAASGTIATGIALCQSADQTDVKIGILPRPILVA